MIYTDIARVLRDARAYASSVTQLRMLDQVVYMMADQLAHYNNFNADHFYKYTEVGNNVPLFNEIGNTHE